MSFITVKAGAKAGAFTGEDGAYAATLVEIEGPRTVTPKDGREPFDLIEWTFAVEGAPDDACLVWTSTSTASGPKSRMYGFLTALLGGRAPAVGQGFEAKDLIGRGAMITIRRDEDGWTKVDNVSALPRQPQAAPTPTPALSPRPAPRIVGRPSPVARTLREVVETDETVGDDGLPF